MSTLELALAHTPLCSTARYSVVAFNTPVFSGLAVEAISVQVVPSGGDCHFTINPVCPLTLIVVLFPAHTGLTAASAVPPTLAGSTVTVATLELALGQAPLCTTARNCVVWLRFPVGSGLAVEAISVQVLPSSDDCHFTIAPT